NAALTAAEVGNIIRTTARPLRDNPGDPVPNNQYGHGLVQADAAVRAALPPRPTLITACPSVVVRCPTASLSCPSVAIRCPSRPVLSCPSVVIQCPSQLVTGCVSRPITACPSVIDRCPTATPLCNVVTEVACPSR